MAHRSRLAPAVPENAWWRPLLVALATVPTFVLGFETYAIGAFVLLGLLALLHTPHWLEPRSVLLWAGAGLVLAGAGLFFLVAPSADAMVAKALYAAMVGAACGLVAVGLAGAGWPAGLAVAAVVGTTTGLVAAPWSVAAAPVVFGAWVLWRLARVGPTVWRAPNGAVRHAFLVAYLVFLTAFAGVYTPIALTGAQGAADALAQATVSCGTLVEDCAAFTALATRGTLVDTITEALARNQAGSASVAAVFMLLMASWVSARHRAAGRAGPRA